MNKLFLILNIFLITSCSNKKTTQFFSEKGADGIIAKGEIIFDSLYNGVVNYYDTSGLHLGFSTYRYGIKHGLEVSYYRNGSTRDSSFYLNGMRNGFAYHFSKSKKLTFQGYFLNDRNFGPSYEMNENGEITEFTFLDFEGRFIFQSIKENYKIFIKGDLIQAHINYAGQDDGRAKNTLFLYLILSPFVKSHYELAILNEQKMFISSKKIESDNYYYEQDLPDLPKNHHYAIVLHEYNPHKGQDDLSVFMLE